MKRLLCGVLLSLAVALSGCQKHDQSEVRIGVIAGPEAALMKVAAAEAMRRYHLKVKVIEFTDYTTPNIALDKGDLDANMFQHIPYLNAQKKLRGYQLSVIGRTFLYPMGLYSKKIKALAQIPNGGTVAIPNDPTNEARALMLLDAAGLIGLKPHVDVNATTHDVVHNIHHLKFVEIDAAQLPRTLRDVDLAAINTNYAIPAGLSPRMDALYREKKDVPYVNVVVARTADKNREDLKLLVKAIQSQPVVDKARALFGDGAMKAF